MAKDAKTDKLVKSIMMKDDAEAAKNLTEILKEKVRRRLLQHMDEK